MRIVTFFKPFFIACLIASMGILAYNVSNLYSEGRIVSVTNIKEWLKQNPDVDPNTFKRKDGQTTSVVKVTTIQAWMKAHPNVDPKNIKQFDPPANPAGFTSLTPALTWKNPPDTVNSAILIINKGGGGQTVLETTGIKGESFAVPGGKLNYSSEYVWQIGHVKKNSEIIDGGTFKFTTNKPPAPKLHLK